MPRISLAIMAFFSMTAFAIAQPPRNTGSFSPEGANLPLEKIGRDDLLGIAVYDAPELTRTVRVAANGEVLLPMLAAPIVAAGLYPKELQTVIAAALVAQNFMVHPIVLGKGRRLFTDATAERKLELTDIKRFAKGIVVMELVPAKA